jgi:hypothetical protein
MSRQGRPPKIDIDALCRAYTEHGLGSSELCERFGINWSTVNYHLKRRGLWNGKTRRHFCRKAKQRFQGTVAPSLASIVSRANRIIERVDYDHN